MASHQLLNMVAELRKMRRLFAGQQLHVFWTHLI